LCFTLDNFFRSTEIMVCCSLLGEVDATNVVDTENMADAENVMEVVPSVGGDEVPMVSSDEGCTSSGGGPDDSADERASDNVNSLMYNFGASTITLGHVNKMVEKGYFADGKARALGVETVPELDDDEAVMFEDFFCSRVAHASASCFGRHFVEVSSATPPTKTECNCAALKVFLGCW
jgi:hypothetical protein